MKNVTPEELDNVKMQLEEAQKSSHFIIFETFDPSTSEHLYMITDYHSFNTIKEQRNSATPMRIVRDMVPVTDHLAMWAIAENEASQAQTSDDPETLKKYIGIINEYINKVLVDNKLPENE